MTVIKKHDNILSESAYDVKFFIIIISLFERAFKTMKNGIYFIVIALLVAELSKILIYPNFVARKWCKITTNLISLATSSV